MTSISTSSQTRTTNLTIADPVINSSPADSIQLSAVIQPAAGDFGQDFMIIADIRDVPSTDIQLNANGFDNPAYGSRDIGVATGVNVYNGRCMSAKTSQTSPLLLYNPGLIYTGPTASGVHCSLDPIEGTSETSVISES